MFDLPSTIKPTVENIVAHPASFGLGCAVCRPFYKSVVLCTACFSTPELCVCPEYQTRFRYHLFPYCTLCRPQQLSLPALEVSRGPKEGTSPDKQIKESTGSPSQSSLSPIRFRKPSCRRLGTASPPRGVVQSHRQNVRTVRLQRTSQLRLDRRSPEGGDE